MTLVTMSKQEFDSLNDERLGSACMGPTFRFIRGKNLSIKAQVISELTPGQQALCLFRVMYDHAIHSAHEFYAWMCYLHDQPGHWKGVIDALMFFDDRAMLDFLEHTSRSLHSTLDKSGMQWSEVSPTDLDHDMGLHNLIQALYTRFQTIAPLSMNIIGNYIRSFPHEFVVLEA